MNGKTMLYIDQYGSKFFARTVKELRSQIGTGGGRVSKMYRDPLKGPPLHVGYVVGSHWLTGYIRMGRPT